MDSFTRAGLTFDVRDEAPVGAPSGTVVLLHGFPQDGTSYDAVVPLLTAQGLRVLVPDQRGYSPGARPRGRAAYALRELVADVVALLEAAGVERAHIVGHDWGGAVAWAFANRRPWQTLSLTALGTPHPSAMRAAALHSDQLRRSTYMGWFQLPRLPEAVLLADDAARLRAALSSSGLPGEVVDHYAERMLEPGALRSALGWYRAIPLSRGLSLGRVPVPTVYLSGRDDPYFAQYGVEATGRYVTGPYRLVELDTGHWLPELHPVEVADAVLSHTVR